METLTDRQAEVLNWIRYFIKKNSFPPTRAEIGNAFGWVGDTAATDHLQALERKGHIEIVPRTARGLRLVDQP